MIRNTLLSLALVAVASPALAQSDEAGDKWSGFYVGASIGNTDPRGGDDGTLLFDTDLDGSYGDTVRTGAGADAFSPGFCGGVATGRGPPRRSGVAPAPLGRRAGAAGAAADPSRRAAAGRGFTR